MDRVVFYNGSQTIEFQTESGGWKILQPQLDEGDDTQINQFLIQFLRQDVLPIEVSGEINWSQYGLTSPQGYFLIKTKRGEEYRVDISSEKTFNDRYYLRKQDQLFVGYAQWGSL